MDGEIDMVDNLRGLKFNGYQVLLNFLPEIREMDDWHNNSIMRQRFMTLAHTCDDMFTRHIGHLDDLLEYEKKYLYNPFSCFSSGIRWILWLPSNILLWCGFISENTGNKLRYNWFIKTLTFIVTIIGLISSAVTIVIGWEQFNEMILRWINK